MTDSNDQTPAVKIRIRINIVSRLWTLRWTCENSAISRSDAYECSKNTRDSTNIILSSVWEYRCLLEDTNQEYARDEILKQNSPGRYFKTLWNCRSNEKYNEACR